MALTDYVWLVPALSALAFVLVAAIGRWTPAKGGWLAVALVGAAGALSLGIFWQVVSGAEPVTFENPLVTAFEWWSVGDYTVNLGTYLDPLTALMLFVVGILVSLIALYSTSYMHDEGDAQNRYYVELSLFITGMLGLVVSSNYLELFIFWEIMGLCSYLLIGYWFTKPTAASAAKKAFLVTRVGDVFLLVGLAILLTTFGTLDFDALFGAVGGDLDAAQLRNLGIANLFIFIGAVGKSAQFPLHVWLPDAMEGPTTVSALIHAATMVKAGVYLVARSWPLMAATPWVLVTVAVLGGFTALFAATMALVNNDLKRVLAYSTLSQLGYMFLGLGVAGALFYAHGEHAAAVETLVFVAVAVAIFHLFSHAFFKAGLFLSAGSVGHAVHTYDMRLMGGLRKHMPVTAFAMLMGTISIAGIPPFSGFFSKDALLHAVWEAYAETNAILYLVLYGAAVLTAGLTAYYMFRLYFMTFEGDYRGHEGEELHHTNLGPGAPAHPGAPVVEHREVHLHESPPTMTTPLVILGLFAIFGGLLMYALLHGDVGIFLWRGGDEGVLHHFAHGFAAAFVEPFTHWQTYLTLAAAAIGIFLAYTWWGPRKVAENVKPVTAYQGFPKVLYHRYYIDNVYNAFAEKVVLGFAKIDDWFDRNVIDGIVNGVGAVNQWSGQKLRKWNTGNVQDYALTFLAGFVLIVLLVLYVPIVRDNVINPFLSLIGGI